MFRVVSAKICMMSALRGEESSQTSPRHWSGRGDIHKYPTEDTLREALPGDTPLPNDDTLSPPTR